MVVRKEPEIEAQHYYQSVVLYRQDLTDLYNCFIDCGLTINVENRTHKFESFEEAISEKSHLSAGLMLQGATRGLEGGDGFIQNLFEYTIYFEDNCVRTLFVGNQAMGVKINAATANILNKKSKKLASILNGPNFGIWMAIVYMIVIFLPLIPLLLHIEFFLNSIYGNLFFCVAILALLPTFSWIKRRAIRCEYYPTAQGPEPSFWEKKRHDLAADFIKVVVAASLGFLAAKLTGKD